jgi:thioredoxin 1
MKTNNRVKSPYLWFGPAVLAAVVIAGCAGHNGFFSPEPESKDSLEHVTSATFEERVLKSDKPVLVDFYAEWCGPCKQLTPLLEEFASEHPEIRVVKVNVDDNPELTRRYGIRAMPTLMVIRDGKVTTPPRAGFVPKSKLMELVAGEGTSERG